MYRVFETKDIVKRAVLLRPDRINIENYPAGIKTFFNSSIIYNEEENLLEVYGRFIVGYYKYVSAIAKLNLNLENNQSQNYSAETIIMPDNKLDFWGCEDPRAYNFNGYKFITYTGRTENYFSGEIEKTVPVTAVKYKNWIKKFYLNYKDKEYFKNLVSDKNAFFFLGNRTYFFHRLHIKDSGFKLVISEVEDINEKIKDEKNLEKVDILDYKEINLQENFEKKTGWATPPLEIENNKYLLVLHAVGHDEVYRAFAILINKKTEILGISKYYFLEPKTAYEKFGDRPFTIFPCGIEKVDDELLISYGASDYFTVIGKFKIDELLDFFIFFD